MIYIVLACVWCHEVKTEWFSAKKISLAQPLAEYVTSLPYTFYDAKTPAWCWHSLHFYINIFDQLESEHKH